MRSAASSDSRLSITSFAISLADKSSSSSSLVSSSSSTNTAADFSSSEISSNKYFAFSNDKSSIISAISAMCNSTILEINSFEFCASISEVSSSIYALFISILSDMICEFYKIIN